MMLKSSERRCQQGLRVRGKPRPEQGSGGGGRELGIMVEKGVGVDPVSHLESHWSLPSCARALPASKDLGDTPPISDLRRLSDFNKLRLGYS